MREIESREQRMNRGVGTNPPSSGDRLYAWVAVGAALIVFIGFARTYFLRGIQDSPTAASASSSWRDLDALVCLVFCADPTRVNASD